MSFLLVSVFFFFHCFTLYRKDVGMPKALMLAKLGNSDAALTQALRDGDVYVVREKGRDFYAFKTLEVTRSSGVKSTTSMKAPDVELKDVNQQAAMGSFFSAFQDSLTFGAPSSSSGLTDHPASKGHTFYISFFPAFSMFIWDRYIASIDFLFYIYLCSF